MRARIAATMVASLMAGCARDPAPAPAAATHLRATFRPVLSSAVTLIAQEGGYFKRHGLDVEFVSGGHNRDSFPSLIEGHVDVLTSTVSPGYFNAIAAGADVRIVAEMGRLDPNGCSYAAFVARKDVLRDGRLVAPPPPKKLRIALRRGSASEFMLGKAVQAEGLGPDRYEVAFLSAEVEGEALRKGAVDVVLGNAGGLDQLLLHGSGVVWRTGQSLTPDFPFIMMLYGPSLLRKDPDAGRRFMSAYLEAVAQYNEGKTERNLRILEGRVGLDRKALLASCWIPIRNDGKPDLPSLRGFEEWALRKGLLDRILTSPEFWDPQFVDSAAQALRKP